ncbi:MAG: lamin tail domain-containing protein [Phycisphaerae bacterium]|nr:lamin tail domain-containing protein [Phycisphaerae bacterium]
MKSPHRMTLAVIIISMALPIADIKASDSVIVFNEIMYHPHADADVEWVELHNLFAIDVDISKWSIREGITYVFPEGTIIPAHGHIVVTDLPAALALVVDADQVYGPFTGSLSNSGEQLVLYNNDNRVMDRVDYRDAGEWPVAPDGSGATLAKRKPTALAELPTNWTWSAQCGGTPGKANFPGDQIKAVRRNLIKAGDTWRFDDSGVNRGTLWRHLGYNDYSWATGRAGFHSGQDVIGQTPTAITTLYSTGRAPNGGVLSPGQADPHYFITSSLAPVTVMQNHPAWAANDASSMWIGLSAQGTDNQPGGNYSFSTKFDLTGWVAETAALNFRVAVDNELLGVSINGVSTGITSIGHDALKGPFTISSGFVSGVNQIDFIFQNWEVAANPMGLRIDIAGAAIPVLGNTQVNQGPVTHYFRKTFVYDGNPQAWIALELNHLVDDGAAFYLNGAQIHRYNMPENSINYLTPALSDVAEPQMSGFTSIPVTNMMAGNNVLAVEVHQSAQNNDVLFAAIVNATESSGPSVEPIKVAFNEITRANHAVFWLELVNYGETLIDLTDCALVCAGSTAGEYTFPAGSLNPGDYLVLDGATLGFRPADEDRLFLYSSDRTAVLDAAVVKNSDRARFPAATGKWQYPDVLTPGAANSFAFNDAVVINEIMYNHGYVQGRPAQYQTSLIVEAGAAAATWVPTNDSYGSTWTGGNEPFNDASWSSGVGSVTGIGYDRDASNDYGPWIGTNVHNAMYNKNRSVYVRIPFTVSSLDGIDELALKMFYDDAFIAYINGVEVARSAHVPAVVRWDAGAVNSHEATSFEHFDITGHKGVLVEGQNILALHGFNFGITSSDMIILPELELKQQIAPQIEDGESPEEWIELFNKGDIPIDLSGWKLEDAVDYKFASGTTIGAGEYIVIARDAAALAAKYPDIRIVGAFDGKLSNATERIVLVDNKKNTADEVRYYDGDPWPAYADGCNASLELRNPNADNSKAMAWRASDESSRTSWNTYTYRAAAAASAVGPDGQWQEFILGLLDAGEVLLDDISVIEDPDGSRVQLIQNGTFESGAAAAWRMLGNHGRSEVISDPDNAANKVLRFIATGTAGHLHNHAETTLAGGRTIVNGRQYEISFKAKWIAGSNQLNSRLYFNRVAKTVLIEKPEANGTPGRQNSRYESNIGPTFSDLAHYPPVPYASEPVTVSVAAEDPDGVSDVRLFWRPDGQSWNSQPMNAGPDGRYRAVIPAMSTSTVVQFYAEAVDGLGTPSMFPPQGPDARALYKVNDNLAADNGLNNFRIIMLSDDYNWMHTNINLMSDDRVGATVIYNESEIFYDAGVRLKSSQRHRHEAGNVGFNVSFPADHLFGGVHATVALDRSEGTSPGQREMLIHIAMNRAGSCQLTKYTDLVKVIAPAIGHTGSAELQLARFNSVFLDDQFENGSDGQVYEYEYIYYPQTTRSGDPQDYKLPQPDGVTGKTIRDYGADKESYRWQFLKKNNRAEDEYQGLMDFARNFGTTGAYFNEHVAEMIDVDQWLGAFAVAVACGAGDNYGGDNSQHNMQLYVRPSDGRTLYFPHDLDAFYSATRPLIANSDLSRIIASPGYERLYYGHVRNVLITSYNTAYMKRWTDQMGQLLPFQPFASHLSFIGQRNSYLTNEIAGRVAPAYPFEITGYNPIVADSQAVVSGKAWINVKHVYLQGLRQPLELSWTSTGSGASKVFYWSTAVPLEPGANDLVFEAYNFQGNMTSSRTITITSTVAERPLRDYLKVTEVMYNPIGGTDYEFIELYNSGPKALDLRSVKMVQDAVVLFDFANSPVTSLAPDDYVLILNNPAAFALRYNTSAMHIAGQYSGNFSNSGERLTFKDAWDAEILSFEYKDSRGWPLAGDGAGHSIVPVDWVIASKETGLLEYGGNWRQSTYIHGSPGAKDPDRPQSVVLNEIMVHTDYNNPALPQYDSNDWIELYNPTMSEVVLTGNHWFLSDNADDLKKWAIPETRIAAGGRISYDEVTGFHNPITQGFGLNKAGEQIYLSCLPGAPYDRVVDCIRFKAQPSNASLGRYPDGGDYWHNMPPSRNASNNTPLDHIVISELMYYPPDGAFEYIELYNPTAQPIRLWDTETSTGWRLDGGVDYVFSPNAIIGPLGHLIIVPFVPDEAGLAAFKSCYGDQPAQIVGPYSGKLSDVGNRVALERPEAADAEGQSNSWAIVDEVIYFSKSPWDAGAAGTGRALWRTGVDRHGSDPAAWSTASPKPGTLPYDFDANGAVDLADWAYMAECWMMEASDPRWNPELNLNGPDSAVIDWSDMVILLEHWLWTNR